MDLVLLELWALIRPMMLIEVDFQVFGLGFFEIIGIGFIFVLSVSLLFRISMQKAYAVTEIEIAMLLFVAWVMAGAVIYPDKTSLDTLIKWTTPFLTWFVAKNAISTKETYTSVLGYLFIGMGVLSIVNAFAIAFFPAEKVLDDIPWRTGLGRYEGLLSSSGMAGQTAGLTIIIGAVLLTLRTKFVSTKGLPKLLVYGFSSLVIITSIYIIVKSQSRTAMVGVIAIGGIILFRLSWKYIAGAMVFFVFFVLMVLPSWELIFYDFKKVYEGEKQLESLGSGRPKIWAHNLAEFDALPFHRKILGAGVGNSVSMYTRPNKRGENIWASHNDFLYVLMHSGIVGLLIFCLLQFFIFRRIMKLPADYRFLFMGAFFAVQLMNFSSNAFVTRYVLGQMYYLLVVFVILPGFVLDRKSSNNISSESATSRQI